MDAFFETLEKDGLGRIGRLRTKSGTVETPCLLPVVNPTFQPVRPKEIKETFGYEALITNAYLVKRRFGQQAVANGIHATIDFPGVIDTDSGGYQILSYGKIDVSAEEIVDYQEAIGSDIAVILDLPTGFPVSREHAKWTVDETIRRADKSLRKITRDDILWVGPIQGGTHLDILAESARQMAVRPFSLYALGSPTRVMEQYNFDILVDMILTAKARLPIEKPFHLFGAGHPFMFALAVLLGCDLFDSASYALYARRKRYLTTNGTMRLDGMRYLPCSCEVCSKTSPQKLLELSPDQRENALARHNLWICVEEIKRVKQSIIDGRLWELMEQRSRAHPSLLDAFRRLGHYKDLLEAHAPGSKGKGLLLFSRESLSRPSMTRHFYSISEKYKPPRKRNLLLIRAPKDRPYHKSWKIKNVISTLKGRRDVHIVLYGAPFGIVPLELDDAYPISQSQSPVDFEVESQKICLEVVLRFVAKNNYPFILVENDGSPEAASLVARLRRSRKSRRLRVFHLEQDKTDPRGLKRLLARPGRERSKG